MAVRPLRPDSRVGQILYAVVVAALMGSLAFGILTR